MKSSRSRKRSCRITPGRTAADWLARIKSPACEGVLHGCRVHRDDGRSVIQHGPGLVNVLPVLRVGHHDSVYDLAVVFDKGAADFAEYISGRKTSRGLMPLARFWKSRTEAGVKNAWLA